MKTFSLRETWPARASRAMASGYGMQQMVELFHTCPACLMHLQHIHGELAPLDWAMEDEPRNVVIGVDWGLGDSWTVYGEPA